MKATAKELRFNSKELIDSVSRGEEIVITLRGKPCAKLVPYQGKKKQIEENKLFGIWQDNDSVKNVDEHVRNLRKER